MKRRYLYALMYSVPALIFSVAFMAVVTAAIAGVLWLFVFGDNTWPSFVDRYSPIFMASVLAAVWLTLLWGAFIWGKRQEASPSLNMKHVYLAAGSTAALVLAIFLHQLSVGNIGPKPDVIVCVDFCTTKKFPASRSPGDGTCRCYDDYGRHEALSTSMSQVRSERAE